VRAKPRAHGLVVLAGEIECFGALKLAFVAIGRAQRGDNHLALGNRYARDADFLARKALGGCFKRPVVAEQFFDGGFDEPWIAPQLFSWAGFSSNARVPLPMRFTVVSCPAATDSL
jgi:hypothetical protein